MNRASYILIGTGTLTVLVLATIVLSGGIDQLSNDGAANRKVALQSLGLYWALGLLAVLVWSFRTRYWKQVLLAGVSVLLTCGGLELGLRLLYPQLAYPDFRYLRSADQHHVAEANKYSHLGYFEGRHLFVQTNEDGLRSGYSREQFLSLSTRIVCLGDSFTFGAWLDARESYPAELEQQLRSRLENDSIGVLNAGMLSYSPLLEEKMLDRVVKHYRPQIVILMLDCTDIGDDYNYGLEYQPNRVTPGPFDGPKLSRPYPHYGALWRLLKPCHQPVLAPFRLLARTVREHEPFDPYGYYKFSVNINGSEETNRFFIYRHPLEETRPFFDVSWDTINRIAEKCEAMNARFVLVVAPRYHHWNASECPKNWELSAYDVDEPYQFEFFRYFQEQAGKAAFPVYSMLEDFQETKVSPLVFESDPHWNSRGHQLVAETITKLLINKQELLPIVPR